ncbi:hypothetical protein PG995_015614 [Apiospora arundinis]
MEYWALLHDAPIPYRLLHLYYDGRSFSISLLNEISILAVDLDIVKQPRSTSGNGGEPLVNADGQQQRLKREASDTEKRRHLLGDTRRAQT